MSNIYEANNQWNNRPVDEPFWGIEDAAEQRDPNLVKLVEIVREASKEKWIKA